MEQELTRTGQNADRGCTAEHLKQPANTRRTEEEGQLPGKVRCTHGANLLLDPLASVRLNRKAANARTKKNAHETENDEQRATEKGRPTKSDSNQNELIPNFGQTKFKWLRTRSQEIIA
jgi:hypothetical protein